MNKRGQSIIEYALIAVLVILGVVIMGPYVLRSVDAHFKLWDVGVKDAFEENPTQAPASDIPYINTTCVCQPDTSSGCGSSVATSQCGPNQIIMNHVCNPQFCDHQPASYCVQSDSCCSTYYPMGCGHYPIPMLNGVLNPGAEINPPTPAQCYYGQQITATQCSDISINCVPDGSCPMPCCTDSTGACQANPPTGGIWCPDPTTATTGLTQNTLITPVANQAACNTATTKCQYYQTTADIIWCATQFWACDVCAVNGPNNPDCGSGGPANELTPQPCPEPGGTYLHGCDAWPCTYTPCTSVTVLSGIPCPNGISHVNLQTLIPGVGGVNPDASGHCALRSCPAPSGISCCGSCGTYASPMYSWDYPAYGVNCYHEQDQCL